MDWKDKLQEIKGLFPAKAKKSNNNKLPIDVLEKRLFSKVTYVCREFGLTKPQLADVLRKGNYYIDINNEGERITPGMYLYLSKSVRPIYYELNKDNIAKILGKLQSKKSDKKQERQKKSKSKKKTTREPHRKTTIPKSSATNISIYSTRQDIAANSKITKKIVVKFEDILFDDYVIRIRNGNHVTLPYPLKESKKSFFLLKKYFRKLNFAPLKVTLHGNTIKNIENINQLDQAIEFLKVIEIYVDSNNNIESVSANKLLKKLEKISNETIKCLANIDSIEKYFDYLNEIQSIDFKIVPVLEIINNGHQVISEDTYLYSVSCRNSECLLIIWESSSSGRATYVFLSNRQNYINTIQAIFDYISSNRKAKRLSLRRKESDLPIVDCVGFIKHHSFEQWKIKIDSFITTY